MSTSFAYRPKQWSANSPASVSPPLTILTAPTPNAAGGPVILPGVLYVFDNALHAVHEQDLEITTNPVQTGASISDHSYLLPAVLTIQILMSDAMESYVVGQFTGTQSRSVSAYQTLLALQVSQSLLQVATRLRSYTNMLIKSVRPEEDATTRYGLKCSVTFQQILLASVEVTTSTLITGSDSELDQVISNTVAGPTQTSPVPANVVTNNSVVSSTVSSTVTATNTAALNGQGQALPSSATTIVGYGAATSSNVNQLPTSITTQASLQGYTLPPAGPTIASLPTTINALARATGASVPLAVVSPVAYAAGIGSTVMGAGAWSSNNVNGLALVLSGVNRY